jgi:TonB family protein
MAEGFGAHMSKGKDLLSNVEFVEAIAEFQKAVESKPKSIEAQSWLAIANERWGVHLFKVGETDKAIDAYRKALEAVPDDPYWHENLGTALNKKGDRDSAIKEYQAATQLEPLDGGLRSAYEKLSGGLQGTANENLKTPQVSEHPKTYGGSVSAPVPTYKPEPKYSDQARRAKLQGTLKLMVTIDREGNVSDTMDIEPLGLGLDARGLETVRTWKFQPAMLEGQPVPVSVEVKIAFRFVCP